jgi:hypothetical protein
MEDIPGPVKLHFGRDGFNHESSADWFDWVLEVDMSRTFRSAMLGEVNSTIDTVTTGQKEWLRSVRKIRPKKFQEVRPDLLRDYSEVQVIRERFDLLD